MPRSWQPKAMNVQCVDDAQDRVYLLLHGSHARYYLYIQASMWKEHRVSHALPIGQARLGEVVCCGPAPPAECAVEFTTVLKTIMTVCMSCGVQGMSMATLPARRCSLGVPLVLHTPRHAKHTQPSWKNRKQHQLHDKTRFDGLYLRLNQDSTRSKPGHSLENQHKNRRGAQERTSTLQ